MQNFTYHIPTEIVFGKDTENQAGALVKKYKGTKALLVYGGGSAIRSGLLDRVRQSLKQEHISWTEWSGVSPNPRLAHAQDGVAFALEQKVDFILAVGGGSAIDESKAIAHGAANPETTIWDIWTGTYALTHTLPIGVVLTLAASGSETSDSAVLTNEVLGRKAGLNSELNRPVFAIMNPELTYTLPKYQIGCGVVDIMMHTLERYFIPNQSNRMTDEIAEGLLRTVIDSGRISIKNPNNYDAMSELMWAGSLSHNNLTGLGRNKDFSVHKLGHALSARFDCAHGASLSAVWSAWAEYVYRNDIDRFCHFGEKVWGITAAGEEGARAAIKATTDYFRELEMPTSLPELGIGQQPENILKALALDATMGGTVKLSWIRRLDTEDVYNIFAAANEA